MECLFDDVHETHFIHILFDWFENPALFLEEVSHTFHGRDIMAPAAAHLSMGYKFKDTGAPAGNIVFLEDRKPSVRPGFIEGRVIYADRFGNLITNIRSRAVRDWKLVITAGPVEIGKLSTSYNSVKPGEYLALPGSSGFLEIARNMGSAEDTPELTLGVIVRIRRLP